MELMAATLPKPCSDATDKKKTAPLAQKVSNIPELLEAILQNLDLQDILRAQQVNRLFFNVIEGSTNIERQVGLRADFEAPLDLPLANLVQLNRFVVYPQSGFAKAPEKDIKCGMGIHIPSNTKLPSLGQKSRSVLFCQPPVTHIDAFVPCCCPNRSLYLDIDNETPIASLGAESGLTIRQL